MIDEVAGNADHVGVNSIVDVTERQYRYRLGTKFDPFAPFLSASVRTPNNSCAWKAPIREWVAFHYRVRMVVFTALRAGCQGGVVLP